LKTQLKPMQTLWPYLLPLQHVDLLEQLIRRDVQARYRQSLLGSVWLVVAPLAMLVVLTVVFRQVMGVRWPMTGSEDSDLAFALRLFAGLAIFQFVAECINRSPTLVLAQPQLVKKVVFPLELLAWVSVAGSGIGFLVSAALVVVGTAFTPEGLTWPALCLPLIWLPLVPLLLGLSWGLSAIGTFVPDVGQVLPPAMSALMFLSPIFYPVEALPAAGQAFMALNPLAEPITQTRLVLLEGHWPAWGAWSVHALACLLVAVVGAALFARVRAGFADVL
jgi:lipopolysaccharide transport system permease protein